MHKCITVVDLASTAIRTLDYPMVLLLEGNSERGAHVRSNICLRRLISTKGVTNRIFFSRKDRFFLPRHIMSYHLV